MRQPYDVVIVGAGPAGESAAVAAAGAGADVLLLERMDRPALKLLASGGGRCNITRMESPEHFAQAFGKHGRFIMPAMSALGPQALRDWLSKLGVPTRQEGQAVYPLGGGQAVQNALRPEMRRLGVDVRLGAAARSLTIEAGRVAGVRLDDGTQVASRGVVLACGGRGYAKLGGSVGGYELARQAGHEVTALSPALVGLVTAQRWVAKLAGVALSDATVRIDLGREGKAGTGGGVLFTHRGITGPAVLDISGRVGELLLTRPTVPLVVQADPACDVAEWQARLSQWRSQQPRKHVATLLAQHVPASLAGLLVEQAGAAQNTQAAQMPGAAAKSLAQMLGGLPLSVTATEGWDHAMVTRGGVSLSQVDPRTLCSRLVDGLAFAGEILDLDGPCGGYNLQWAFASGRLAGASATRFKREHE